MAEPLAEPEVAGQERAARRLVIIGLLAAAAASGVALALALLWQRTPSAPAGQPVPVPATFREAGFIGGVVHHVGGGALPAAARSGVVRADVRRGSVAVVVACSTGSATIRIGAAEASARCTGHATGVVVISAPGGRLDVRGSVSVRQPRPWTIGIYQ